MTINKQERADVNISSLTVAHSNDLRSLMDTGENPEVDHLCLCVWRLYTRMLQGFGHGQPHSIHYATIILENI